MAIRSAYTGYAQGQTSEQARGEDTPIRLRGRPMSLASTCKVTATHHIDMGLGLSEALCAFEIQDRSNVSRHCHARKTPQLAVREQGGRHDGSRITAGARPKVRLVATIESLQGGH